MLCEVIHWHQLLIDPSATGKSRTRLYPRSHHAHQARGDHCSVQVECCVVLVPPELPNKAQIMFGSGPGRTLRQLSSRIAEHPGVVTNGEPNQVSEIIIDQECDVMTRVQRCSDGRQCDSHIAYKFSRDGEK